MARVDDIMEQVAVDGRVTSGSRHPFATRVPEPASAAVVESLIRPETAEIES